MQILIENRQKTENLDLRGIRKFLRRLMKELSLAGRTLSVIFVDNNEIREINRAYLGRDAATNVISFSLTEGDFGDINPHMLGDIMVSVERAREDALQSGLDFPDQVDFLLLHGLLHLAGYDHENVSATVAREMEAKERELFLTVKGIKLDTG